MARAASAAESHANSRGGQDGRGIARPFRRALRRTAHRRQPGPARQRFPAEPVPTVHRTSRAHRGLDSQPAARVEVGIVGTLRSPGTGCHPPCVALRDVVPVRAGLPVHRGIPGSPSEPSETRGSLAEQETRGSSGCAGQAELQPGFDGQLAARNGGGRAGMVRYRGSWAASPRWARRPPRERGEEMRTPRSSQDGDRIRPLVGTPVPAVTRTGPSPGTWLTAVPRTWRTASAMPFMPWM